MQRKICPTCKTSYPVRLERCPDDGTLLESQDNQHPAWAAGKLVGGRYVIFAETTSNEITCNYRVRSLDLDEARSLRALQPRFAFDKAAAEEFRRTTRLLRSLRHPNLVTVESAGDADDGSPFMTTEIVPGRSLAELIQADAPLPARRVCSIARQIGAALDAAHRRGLLHLGLNPSVIFVAGPPEDETVKVQDFGADYVRLGRNANGSRSSGLALRDLMPANSLYCSPEQALGTHSESLDARADLYSLGLILFQMLTGRLPFPAPSSDANGRDEAQLASLVARLEEPIALPAAEAASIPEPLVTLVTQLLERRPALRPASAQQVIEKLGLVEDWMAARALMGLRTEPAPSPVEAPLAQVRHEEPAPLAAFDAELQKRPGSAPASALSEARLAMDAGPPATSSTSSAPPPDLPFERGLDRAGSAPAEAPISSSPPMVLPSGWKDSSSVLFKAEPAKVKPSQRSAEWGRWALAALALLVLAAGVFFLVTHGFAPGPGPLSPVKSDELQTTEQAPSSAVPTDTPSKPPETAPQSQASGQSAVEAPVRTAPPASGSAKSSATHAAVATPAVNAEDLDAQVQRAITAGDVFFEQGKYDLAVQAYQRPLKLDPGNAKLRARIERARKAKAAEQQFLGEQ